MYYIVYLLRYYQNNIAKNRCLLVFDRATTHINDEIINFLHANNILYVLIPPGFTRFLQPLDVSVNRAFKIALKKNYLNYQQKHLDDIFHNQFTIKNEEIINMIYEIWSNENDIKKNVIIDAFLFCEITINFFSE